MSYGTLTGLSKKTILVVAHKDIKPKEIEFWSKLINKYLKPLDKDKEKEKRDAQGLTELRNTYVFSFLLINGIWIALLFMMQLNKDSIYFL